MRVVFAPDSFKGSIGAAPAAAAMAEGWLAERPGDEVACLPLADGGEGTLDVVAATAGPDVRWHEVRVSGPDGGLVDCPWLELPDGTAVVELARCAGLPLLTAPDALGAHTFGLGEVIGHALDAGVNAVTVGLGGSASTDGGAGALAALGARFLASGGLPSPLGGGALADLESVDTSGLRLPPAGGVTCLVDVSAPLLGPRGAAAVFGPQKGAGPAEAARLEAGLGRLASLLGGDAGAPGAGAAGGTGYGLATAWGAALMPGAAELCRVAGLGRLLARAGLVVTGEGRYDPTSLVGKVTGTVIAAASAAGVPCVLVAGQAASEPSVPAIILSALAGGPGPALADPHRWLRTAARILAAQQAR